MNENMRCVDFLLHLLALEMLYSVLVSVSWPKGLFHLENDNLFHITLVIVDWLV